MKVKQLKSGQIQVTTETLSIALQDWPKYGATLLDARKTRILRTPSGKSLQCLVLIDVVVEKEL